MRRAQGWGCSHRGYVSVAKGKVVKLSGNTAIIESPSRQRLEDFRFTLTAYDTLETGTTWHLEVTGARPLSTGLGEGLAGAGDSGIQFAMTWLDAWALDTSIGPEVCIDGLWEIRLGSVAHLLPYW